MPGCWSPTKSISILEMETDNEKTKNLIDCYSPVLYGDIDLMKKHMLDLSESWKEKEKAFKTAIRFVVNNDDEIDESKPIV